MKWQTFVRYRLAAVLWSIALLLASTGWFSARTTGAGLATLLAWVLGREPSITTLEIVNFIARKLAHLVAYGIEGALMWRAVRFGRTNFEPRWIAYTLGWTLLVASLDELNQSFSRLRTGSAADVLLDMMGAAIAVFLLARRRAQQ